MAMPPRISARWEIDLSPGMTASPRRPFAAADRRGAGAWCCDMNLYLEYAAWSFSLAGDRTGSNISRALAKSLFWSVLEVARTPSRRIVFDRDRKRTRLHSNN